jgi:hypothetical protein
MDKKQERSEGFYHLIWKKTNVPIIGEWESGSFWLTGVESEFSDELFIVGNAIESPSKILPEVTDWNSTMDAYTRLITKKEALEVAIWKSRKRSINKGALQKKIDDCIQTIRFELIRADKEAVDFGIIETNKILLKDEFAMFSTSMSVS